MLYKQFSSDDEKTWDLNRQDTLSAQQIGFFIIILILMLMFSVAFGVFYLSD